jgi:TrmH family RNA methyltransferase
MGSFCNVNISYRDLTEFLKSVKEPVYGAFLDGESIGSVEFDPNSLIVIGNESGGITESVAAVIKNRIKIPGRGKAESLNASIAAGILLYAASISPGSQVNNHSFGGK